jgi:hypothetical protein
MLALTIKSGAQESESYKLGNKQVCCVYVPATPVETPDLQVFLYGSPDGALFGPIFAEGAENPLSFMTRNYFHVQTFDAAQTEGVQIFKFFASASAAEDLVFPVYLKEF